VGEARPRLEDLLDSQNERIALSAALGVLQRAAPVEIGLTSAEAINTEKMFRSFTPLQGEPLTRPGEGRAA